MQLVNDGIIVQILCNYIKLHVTTLNDFFQLTLWIAMLEDENIASDLLVITLSSGICSSTSL